MDPPAPAHRFAVAPAAAGSRLDAFLAAALGASRAEARRLLAQRRVAVDGRPATARDKGRSLRAGSEVAVSAFRPPLERRALPDAERPLAILAEGAGWVALDKPAGVAVHPLAEDERGTLLNALVARRPELHGVGEGGLRSGVVHRLDLDTSGVVLFASEPTRWSELRAAFARGEVEKAYRAIALGRLADEGRLEFDLCVTRHRPARVRVAERPEDLRRARRVLLAWRTLEDLGDFCLVEVRPRTGFLHQIRAALAQIGHPLAGDRLYGPGADADASGAARHMLHAAELRFADVVARAPDAADFAALLARLRARAAGSA